MEQPQEVQDAMASANQIIQDMDSLKTRVAKANSDREGFKMRMRAITSDIITAINDIKGTNSALKSQIQTQASRIEEKEAELAELRKEGANNVANGDALANRMDRLGEQIKEKDQELSELKAELAKNEETNTLTGKELEGMKKEINRLESELTQTKAELELSKTAQREMGAEMRRLEGQLVATTTNVSKAYKELEASVITLLDDVESDEQESNLNRILKALKQNEEAVLESASEMSPKIVTPAPEAGVQGEWDKFVEELNKKIMKNFDANSDGTYTIKPGMAIPLGNDRMIVSKEIFDKLKNLNALNEDLKNQVIAYRQYSGISPPRPTAGGTRRKRKGRNLKRKSRKTKKRRSSSTHKKRRSRGSEGKRRSRK